MVILPKHQLMASNGHAFRKPRKRSVGGLPFENLTLVECVGPLVPRWMVTPEHQFMVSKGLPFENRASG